jgi:hypothetical protein
MIEIEEENLEGKVVRLIDRLAGGEEGANNEAGTGKRWRTELVLWRTRST